MPKKGLSYRCPAKVVRIAADVSALGSYGNHIAEAVRSYYRNRPVNLIGSGRRAKKVKGKAPKKKKG